MSGELPTKTTAPARGRGWVIGSAIVAGVLFATAIFGFQEWRLSRHLRLAGEHLPVIRAKLVNDNRFLGVVVKESTTHHGSIRVGGFVVDAAAADDLRTLIDSTHPPVPVDWQLRILGAAAVGEALLKVKTTTAPTATEPIRN